MSLNIAPFSEVSAGLLLGNLKARQQHFQDFYWFGAILLLSQVDVAAEVGGDGHRQAAHLALQALNIALSTLTPRDCSPLSLYELNHISIKLLSTMQYLHIRNIIRIMLSPAGFLYQNNQHCSNCVCVALYKGISDLTCTVSLPMTPYSQATRTSRSA